MNFVEWGVMGARYILLLFSVVSIAVMVERGFALRRLRLLEEKEYSVLRALLDRKLASEAMARATASAAPGVAALQGALDLPGADAETTREAVSQGIEVQSAVLSRNLSVLATVASTAPYVGLFGTVLGILLAFDRIAKTNQTGASVVAAPIAEALTATALGLGVAIPAVIAYNVFSGRANALTLRVETHALDLAARFAALRHSAPQATPSPNGVTETSRAEEVHAS